MKREPIRTIWKQMMPIPEKYAVLVPTTDENDEDGWFEPEKEGWVAPCLVLYEDIYADGEVEGGIAIYVADALGQGDLDFGAKMVPKDWVTYCER